MAALLFSLINLYLYYSFQSKLDIYQDYDYAIRLQLSNERIIFGRKEIDDDPVLTYSATLENSGMKTIDVDSVYMDYGDGMDLNKRMKHVIEKSFFLKSGQQKDIHVAILWKDIDAMKKRFNVDEAMFFLRVVVNSPNGVKKESVRKFGGFNGESFIMVVPRGNIL